MKEKGQHKSFEAPPPSVLNYYTGVFPPPALPAGAATSIFTNTILYTGMKMMIGNI